LSDDDPIDVIEGTSFFSVPRHIMAGQSDPSYESS